MPTSPNIYGNTRMETKREIIRRKMRAIKTAEKAMDRLIYKILTLEGEVKELQK